MASRALSSLRAVTTISSPAGAEEAAAVGASPAIAAIGTSIVAVSSTAFDRSTTRVIGTSEQREIMGS